MILSAILIRMISTLTSLWKILLNAIRKFLIMTDEVSEIAICFECVEDEHLQKIITETGTNLECSVCNENNKHAITIDELAKLMDPIIRDNFVYGDVVKRFGGEDDDKGYWAQQGEPLSWVVQKVLGQYFEFEDEIVDAIVDAEDVWPQDGEEAFFDDSCNYVENRVNVGHYYAAWSSVSNELKHKRRFFNPYAKDFFKELFEDVDILRRLNNESKNYEKVVVELPKGTEIFRARVCKSLQSLKDFYKDPYKQIGPPPQSQANAGRMNAQGVVVFYGAMDINTCIAEMRPAIGGDTAVISLCTDKPLRLLDFTRLESSVGDSLSYFRPDFKEKVEKHKFLRHLHRLISQAITPGKESDYLITQTMTEYLAHVHPEPFDGILFASAQRAQGVNIVLFPTTSSSIDPTSNIFPLAYIDDSIKLYQTESIEYAHTELNVYFHEEEDVYVSSPHNYDHEED
jgi:hypothetical protein